MPYGSSSSGCRTFGTVFNIFYLILTNTHKIRLEKKASNRWEANCFPTGFRDIMML